MADKACTDLCFHVVVHRCENLVQDGLCVQCCTAIKEKNMMGLLVAHSQMAFEG